MRVFDTTTFFEEKLMMDLRFNILDPFVDKFIVCEATFSHSGKKKEIKFDKKDFPKFQDKIVHIIIDKDPVEKTLNQNNNSNLLRQNSIQRIETQRNYISKALEDADKNDYIIYSDNDEIPDLSEVLNKGIKNNFILFKQLFFYYKFNLLYDRIKWFGTKGCKKKRLKNFSSLRNLKNRRYPFWRIDTFFSDIKQTDVKIIESGGWHFTNIKTPEELFEKLSNFGHHDEFEKSNLDVNKIREKIQNKEVFYDHLADKNSNNRWNDNYKLKKIENSQLPKYLQLNSNQFKTWFD